MILVTGATGKLGGHVVRALRSMGQPVRALVRKGSTYYWLNDSGCTYFFGDLKDETTMRRAVSGVHYVVACTGIEHETRADNHSSVTVDGHERLWKYAVERGVSHVVYVSALGVGRDYPVAWFDAKEQAEESLKSSGLSHTILRPAPFVSTFAQMAWKAKNSGRVVIPGTGDNLIAPIATKDLALIAVSCLDLDMARNATLEVSGADAMSASEALDTAMQSGGGDGQVITLNPMMTMGLGKAVRLFGKRWENKIKHHAKWFEEEFVVDMTDLLAATGIEMTSYKEALETEFAELTLLSDPRARDELVVHRKFDAIVYEEGTVSYESLPSGPLRYED
jgi:uncharacterized protein YbjT (DUF2867 family)